MNKDLGRQIVPADFPELKRLVWNRDPTRSVDAEDAFRLYERNWRFVEVEALTERERQLINALEDEFGGGFKLV